MKKIFTLLFILLVTVGAFAQNFHFGLKVAPSITWVKPDTKPYSSAGVDVGFNYGIITDFGFTENYSFSTGIDVSYKGGCLDYVDTITTSTTDYRLQYIEIPLTLKMRTNEIGYITYFGQFGFAPGINLRARADITSTTTVNNTTTIINLEDEDIKDDINVFSTSMIIAIGMEYSLGGKTSFMAGFTFNNGFIDILDDKDSKAITNYLALTLGVLF